MIRDRPSPRSPAARRTRVTSSSSRGRHPLHRLRGARDAPDRRRHGRAARRARSPHLLQGAGAPLRGGRRRRGGDRLLRPHRHDRRPQRHLRVPPARGADDARDAPGRHRRRRGAPALQGGRPGARALLGRLLLRRGALLPPGGQRPRLRGGDRLLRLAARAPALAGPSEADRRGPALPERRCWRSTAGPTRASRRPRSRSSTRLSRGRASQHESVTYDGAPHSFFDRKQTEFAEASADAWRRVQAFVRAHTPSA